MLESDIVDDIKKKVLKPLEPLGFFFKCHGGPFQLAGLPDLLGVYAGLFVGIEVKRPGKEPTKIQTTVMGYLRRAGAVVGVAHSVEEAQAIIDEARAKLERRAA